MRLPPLIFPLPFWWVGVQYERDMILFKLRWG
jgi:hypothetical protein